VQSTEEPKRKRGRPNFDRGWRKLRTLERVLQVKSSLNGLEGERKLEASKKIKENLGMAGERKD